MHIGNRIFAICDAEKEYAFRFMEQLRLKQNLSFQMRVFTDSEKLVHFARQAPIDILLISERSFNEEVAQLRIGRTIVLSEGLQAEEETQYYPSLYKYQSSDAIVREIMSSYREGGTRKTIAQQGEEIRMIGVYSPVSVPQKLLFSMALGMVCAKTSRTLYLNLEAFSGFEEFLDCHYEWNLSDLVYLFRQKSASLAEKMNAMIDQIGGMDYLPPIQTPSDYTELTGEEWIHLIEAIGSVGNYDTIVLDLGQNMPEPLLVLSGCSRIFVPIAEDMLSAAREREFENLLAATGQEALADRLELVEPPPIDLEERGKGALEKLRWSSLGGYADTVWKSRRIRSAI